MRKHKRPRTDLLDSYTAALGLAAPQHSPPAQQPTPNGQASGSCARQPVLINWVGLKTPAREPTIHAE